LTEKSEKFTNKMSFQKILRLHQVATSTCHQSTIRHLSLFRRYIKDFGIESPAYTVINPILATNLKKSSLDVRDFPVKIQVPNYVFNEQDDQEVPPPDQFVINTKEDIIKIRHASSIAAHCVRLAYEILQPGTSTLHLNDILHKEILSKAAYPSILGYKDFPYSISTSVNNVAAHGLPDDRLLEHGDLVSLDVTVYANGVHGLCGSTFLIGDNTKDDPIARHLKSVAQECLHCGISACRPGGTLIDIGAAISKQARKRHLNVIPNLTGHGIGTFFHCPPDVYNVLNNYPGSLLPGILKYRGRTDPFFEDIISYPYHGGQKSDIISYPISRQKKDRIF
jgi:methionyl aminopeptidase